jgi:hypothetical protein
MRTSLGSPGPARIVTAVTDVQSRIRAGHTPGRVGFFTDAVVAGYWPASVLLCR